VDPILEQILRGPEVGSIKGRYDLESQRAKALLHFLPRGANTGHSRYCARSRQLAENDFRALPGTMYRARSRRLVFNYAGTGREQSHPIAKNVFRVTSLKDWNAIPGGSPLGDHPRPKGFDERGRHVLNDVGEFRLVEMWYPGGPRVVEYREDIQDAFDRAFFCVSDAHAATEPAKRVWLAKIVHAFAFWATSGLVVT